MDHFVFQEQLQRFGPAANAAMSLEQAFDYCKALTLSHYENFSIASWLLPRELRRPFHVVYAYCRWSDDLADENDGSLASRKESLRLLTWWEQGLDACFDNPGKSESSNQSETGQSSSQNHPVYKALRKIVQDFNLPKKPFADLLAAFRRDQTQQGYETLDELLDYCRYSADPVGRIVLYLVYAKDRNVDPITKPSEEQLRWSDSICSGLQLANFWQDIARDAKMGRCYIPKQIAKQFGVDFGADLSRLVDSTADSPVFREMLALLVQDARSRLQAGIPLVTSVPRNIRLDIALFIRGGLSVLDAIEKIGYNVLQERPVVSRRKKISLLLSTLVFGIR